jgi:transposase
MDDLYEACVTKTLFQVAAHALQVLGWLPKFVHRDSNSFHLHGAYDREESEREAIGVNYGYSKDHRPDLT